MNIHQLIYETMDEPIEEVHAKIGGCIEAVQRRRDRMLQFLGDHEWDLEEYKVWTRGANRLPSVGTMVREVVGAARDVARQGMELVSESEYESRIDICNKCEFFLKENNRCGQCGCFVKFKSRLVAWHCPLKFW